MRVEEIEVSHSGTHRVTYIDGFGDRQRKEFYAKDELDAYNKFQDYAKKWKTNMRYFTICATLVVVTLLTSLTYSCKDKRDTHSASMRECVKSGKSYISEDGSYSCRDPFVKATN